MGRFNDLTGRTFGRLRVLSPEGRNKNGNVIWKCLCDPELGGCGNTTYVSSRHLVLNNTKSCGCLKREIFKSKCKLDEKCRIKAIKNHRKSCYTGSYTSDKSLSGVKGVYYRKDRNKWQVQIQDIAGKVHSYGLYENKNVAIKVAKRILEDRKEKFAEANSMED